jgi:hypothetical protein
MRIRVALVALSLIVLFGIACSDDDSDNGTAPDVIAVADLVGTWTSTAWTYESRATGEVVDMAASGFSISMIVDEGGRYTLTMSSEGEPLEVETGVLSIDRDVLIATSDDGGETVFFSLSLQGDTADLMNPAAAYEFGDSGVDEPAILRITLTRS